LKGSFELASADGKTSAELKLAGAQLRAQGVDISSPTIAVSIADLASKQIDGVVKATTIASGANKLDDVALNFTLAGPQTKFDLSSQFDGAPLTSTGSVEQADGAIAVVLQSFEAAPRKIAVKLSAPTTITVRDGTALIDNLLISAGDGTIAVKGSAGKALNLEARIDALPASLADTFAKDLGAEGALSANVTVKGNSTAPVVTFDANLTGASTVQTRARGLENLAVTAKGQLVNNLLDADLTTTLKDQPTQATVQVNLAGGKVDIPSIKLTLGETTLTGNVALDAAGKPSGKFNFEIPDAAQLAAVAGQKAEGALKGTLDFAQVDNAIKATLASTGSLGGQPITINLDAISENGGVSLPSLKVDIGKNSISGAINLNAEFLPTGSVTFDLPDLALLAAMAGQTAEGSLKGTADITSADTKSPPTSTPPAPFAARPSRFRYRQSRTRAQSRCPALTVKAGANTLSGAITLDKAFKPSGKIDIDLADIASLAAIANQNAEGALKGSFELASTDGKTSGKLTLAGAQLKAHGVDISSPTIAVSIADLASKQIDGVVKATSIASGTNKLNDVALNFALAGPQTTFDLSSQFDGAPLTSTGSVEQTDGAIAVVLQSFEAAPRKIPVKLSAPTTITVRDGTALIDNLLISAGDGTIAVKGSAGKVLNIEARIDALPASLANTFAKDLGAEGALSANVTVKGTGAAPIVAFDANLTGASTVQTRARGLENLAVTAKGQLANNVLNADLTTTLRDHRRRRPCKSISPAARSTSPRSS
jgi:translocation and assembly module TamB